MIHGFPKLIDEKFLERARKLSVAQLCDGMKELGIPQSGCMCAEINAVDPAMKVVGTAATVETSNGDNFPVHLATYAIGQEGYVMVIDGRAYMEKAYLGDLIMAAAKAAGYIGIVIDGCTRDRSGNINLGFPVFCRGFMPAGPIKKDPGNVNIEITCGGLKVRPGDLVAGDYDGVCVVPRVKIEEVLEKAETKLDYEGKRVETIRNYVLAKKRGEALPQLAPQWVVDMLKQP
jgi:regulator of RNase E activity RraA